MGKNIIWNSLNWTEDDDFITFAFGDFNSKSFGQIIDNDGEITTPASYIIRTSDSNRYNIHLAPPMQDKTADVPGGDGQYYFGTIHKPKVFDISFAFDNLTKSQIQNLKQVFNGKEMRELSFAEDCTYITTEGIISVSDYRVYMAKVTGQPNIKALCFDTDEGEKYRGEGSVQFTAYWPYSRGTSQTRKTDELITNYKEITINNNGDIATPFVLSGANISKIEIGSLTITPTQSTNGTISWDSKTGIIKSGDDIIGYTGNGIYSAPTGNTIIKVYFPSNLANSSTSVASIEYYNWYY